MIAFMALAALAAVGVAQMWRMAVPPRTDLVTGVGHWEQARARAGNRAAASVAIPRSVQDRLAARIAESLTRTGRDLTSTNQDLAITGSTLEVFLSKTLTLMVVAFLGPPALSVLFGVLGLAIPVVAGIGAGLILAAVIGVVGVRELRAQATKRRAELRRAMSIYIDLVAMCMEAGRGHAEALPAAAQIGTGWTFTWIQDAIEGARYSGTTAWVELGVLGRRVGMIELVDLEAALSLAHDDGAKVKASLVARAGTLRAQRVADTEADADASTESMKLALLAMVAAFLAYEVYPAIARLFAG